MDVTDSPDEFVKVLVTEDEIQARLGEIAEILATDYREKNVLLVGVLKGAVMLMADLSRHLPFSVEMDWMAVSSYGKNTTSSGVVRILKDLDSDITDRHVLIVEDIVDSGLTLSWLIQNLRARKPTSLEVFALLRKPDAIEVPVDVKYVGFDIPPDFVVGYGLDYAERYRNLRSVATLNPAVYSERP
jgi:hypoxanthine phosphoribosyltransferase